MKKVFLAVLLLSALFGVLYLTHAPDTDATLMTAKYADERSRFFEDGNGARVHYRDEGNPNGVPIILLHGNSASLHTWEPLVERLGDEYRIITYTHPGHGLTGPNDDHDYAAATMVETLHRLTEELGLEQFVLGGNSMGGWISWRYALAHPDKVDALILLDASGMPLREGETPPPLNLGFRLLQNPVGRFLLQYYTPRAAVEKSVYQSVANEAIVTDAMVDRYWELLRLPGNRVAAAARAQVDREEQYADEARKITAPTLILWGAEDQLIYASAATSFAERIPDTHVVVYEGIGHLPMEEAPDDVARDIDAFLDRVLLQQ